MSYPKQYKAALLEAIDRIDISQVEQAIEWFGKAREGSKHIFVCGNGGSASTASLSRRPAISEIAASFG